MKRFLPVLTLIFAVSLHAQDKADALLLFKDGRTLLDSGKQAEAAVKFNQAIAVCDAEIAQDASRIDAYVVKCWSLFRLGRHEEVIAIGNKALTIAYDYRIVEQVGESYFFVGDYASSVKYLQKYVDAMPQYGDRVPTAYFYLGENYVRMRKFLHADIAYTTAVYLEGSIARWWFRLGQAREMAGEPKSALAAYETALQKAPSYADAVAARDRLKMAAGL